MPGEDNEQRESTPTYTLSRTSITPPGIPLSHPSVNPHTNPSPQNSTSSLTQPSPTTRQTSTRSPPRTAVSSRPVPTRTTQRVRICLRRTWRRGWRSRRVGIRGSGEGGDPIGVRRGVRCGRKGRRSFLVGFAACTDVYSSRPSLPSSTSSLCWGTCL
jgi:hypothetical protein